MLIKENMKALVFSVIILCCLSCKPSATETDKKENSTLDNSNPQPPDNTGNRNGTSTELMDTMIRGTQHDSSDSVK
jgi:hypothetical protein